MRVGIVITTSPNNGGTYYYSLKVLDALRDFGQGNEYAVFYDSPSFPVNDYALPHWTLHYNVTQDGLGTKFARFFSAVGLTVISPLARGRYRALLDWKPDLVICPSTTLAAWWCGLPFIVAIHDIWHRYKLPGVIRFDEPFRDLQWRQAAKSARIVLVESELGKSEVVSNYGILERKIRILPTGPASFIWRHDPNRHDEIRAKYKLPEYYVFYPGGYSPAKNQRRIIEALAILHTEKELNINAILPGPLNAYSAEISKLADELGIGHLVHIVGFVPDEDMSILYRNALCLVMASYIGPTNMPIWEAFAAGCPVISSNVGGMPEQVGDTGLLFDPSDARQLAERIERMYSDKNLRLTLIERGRLRIAPLSPENWARTLLSAIKDAGE